MWTSSDQVPATSLDQASGAHRSGWGHGGARYGLTRFVFLRLVGAIYAVAFLTLVQQGRPLVGADGLLPAVDFLARVREQLGSTSAGFWRLPSLFWFFPSDAALCLVAWLGVGLSVLVCVGFANAGMLAVLWVFYLSFVHIGQIFYGYGWESLLCETGFLAIFLAPARSLSPFAGKPPMAVIVLLRWLTFRIMLGAGLIKMRGDSCWRDLTCLVYYYETQPLPNPLSAAFHRLPAAAHAAGVLFNHFAELVAPWGVFGPKRLRHMAGLVIVAFQVALIASGNLSFLNWLTIAAALSCFDDDVFARFFPARLVRGFATPVEAESRARRVVSAALCVVIALLSVNPVSNLLSPQQRMNAGFDPFELVNTYGAFGSVNRERNEIILEGTADTTLSPDTQWLAFELPCKPGDPGRRPCVAAPYQYKLDWQMWFASFGGPGDEPWLMHLVYKLLRGDPIVDSLFTVQPFRGHPPRFIRAQFYHYRFAPRAEQGTYWERELLGQYLRPLSLDDEALQRYLKRYGFR